MQSALRFKSFWASLHLSPSHPPPSPASLFDRRLARVDSSRTAASIYDRLLLAFLERLFKPP